MVTKKPQHIRKRNMAKQKIWRRLKVIALISFLSLIASAAMYVYYQNYPQRMMQYAMDTYVQLHHRMGFVVERVHIHGLSYLKPELIKKAIGFKQGVPLVLYRGNTMLKNLKQIQSIQYVSVRKTYPHTLNIHIVERIPVVQWYHKSVFYAVDKTGVIFDQIKKRDDLPIVVGKGAPSDAVSILTKIRLYPNIEPKIHYLKKIQNRRWDIVLNDTYIVQLPQQAEEKALRVLSVEINQLKPDYKVLDLRVPNRLIYKVARFI